MTVLEQGVRELLEEFVDIPADALAPLTLDPLTLAEVTQEIEERFGAHVSEADLVPENFRSVSAIVAFITKRRKNG